MSKTRKELISEYDITEQGLKDLLQDLCLQKESAKNLTIIQNALKGTYSDFGSQNIYPVLTLLKDLSDAGYKELAENVTDGKYEHDVAPKFKTFSTTQPLFGKKSNGFKNDGKKQQVVENKPETFQKKI